MNADLKQTLRELGPGFGPVVSRLRAAYEPAPTGFWATLPWRRLAATAGSLVAASIVIAFGVRQLQRDASPLALGCNAAVYTAAYEPDPAAVRSIIAAQNADGSWETVFLTRQNAAALGAVDDACARVAYRRAVRYLKQKGLSPLTDSELRG